MPPPPGRGGHTVRLRAIRSADTIAPGCSGRSRLLFLPGQPGQVDGGRRRSGVVKGIDATGALLLDIGDRVERIVAGEVSVEGAYE